MGIYPRTSHNRTAPLAAMVPKAANLIPHRVRMYAQHSQSHDHDQHRNRRRNRALKHRPGLASEQSVCMGEDRDP